MEALVLEEAVAMATVGEVLEPGSKVTEAGMEVGMLAKVVGGYSQVGKVIVVETKETVVVDFGADLVLAAMGMVVAALEVDLAARGTEEPVDGQE